MTIDELKEFMTANKDEFTGLVKELGFESADDVTGLKSKRDELLQKNRDLKNGYKELESKYSGIDLDEYESLVSSANKGDEKKAEREYKRLQEQLTKEQGKASSLEKALNDSLITSELSKAFDNVKVDSVHRGLLTNAYLGKAKVENDDGKRTVYISDGNTELPAGDYFKQWAEGDAGKPYLSKPENRGAGDKNFNSSANTMTRSEFDSLPYSEKAAIAKNGTKII